MRRATLAGGLGLLLLAVPGTARAFDWGLKLEPGVAVPLSRPQSQLFSVGGAATVKLLFGLGPYLDIGPTFGFVGLPASETNSSPALGVAWQIGGGLRLKRPHREGQGLGAISPWIDADALYVRTGPLNRFGFSAAVGLALPIGQHRRFWLGPFVRYTQIVQLTHVGFDDSDAKLLIVGLSLEAGGPHVRRVEQPACECHDCPVTEVGPPAAECPPIARLRDHDGDGVPDVFDRCPDIAGPLENQGCPSYQRIIVRDDKLELKEHILFAWDSAVIEPESFALLDEVVTALQQNKSFDVQIDGHASSDGADEHNQTLSEARAQSVLDYLVNHGVAKQRLQSKGFSSSVPIESNVTREGREANRRVVFKLELIILKKRSAQ